MTFLVGRAYSRANSLDPVPHYGSRGRSPRPVLAQPARPSREAALDRERVPDYYIADYADLRICVLEMRARV